MQPNVNVTCPPLPALCSAARLCDDGRAPDQLAPMTHKRCSDARAIAPRAIFSDAPAQQTNFDPLVAQNGNFRPLAPFAGDGRVYTPRLSSRKLIQPHKTREAPREAEIGWPPPGLRRGQGGSHGSCPGCAPTQKRDQFVSSVIVSHGREKGSVYRAHADCASVNGLV